MTTHVIIVGAGVAGLSAAKTYKQVNPSIDLTILDDNSTVGGVWSKNRLYSTLWCQSPTGYYEFSDLSMVDDEHPLRSLASGGDVYRYLERYARHHDLLKHVKFNTKVVKARRKANSWVLSTHDGQVFACDKLIISTGLFSKAQIPEIPKEKFHGPVIHSKYLGQRQQELQSSSIKDVVVVGGCKSAVEAISLCLDAGKRVHWVLRERARGVPILVADPEMKPNIAAVGNTRAFSAMSPSIFNTCGVIYNVLHGGFWRIGSWFFNRYWALLSLIVSAAPKYDKSTNGRSIKPAINNMLWLTSYVSLVYSSGTFLRFLHDTERLKVHIASVTRLSDGSAHLSNGASVSADAAIYCTGWSSSTDFFTHEDALDLGLPMALSSQPPDIATHWSKLIVEADNRVANLLPNCRSPELDSLERPKTTQFRTHRTIVSPRLISQGDRSIVFLGFLANGQTAAACELLALWATAWMEDLLPVQFPGESDLEKQVALVNAWMARRYGARGAVSPEIILESQSFFDEVIKDLELDPYRKRAKSRWPFIGWMLEWCEPYRGQDYRGVVEEFQDRVKRRRKEE